MFQVSGVVVGDSGTYSCTVVGEGEEGLVVEGGRLGGQTLEVNVFHRTKHGQGEEGQDGGERSRASRGHQRREMEMEGKGVLGRFYFAEEVEEVDPNNPESEEGRLVRTEASKVASELPELTVSTSNTLQLAASSVRVQGAIFGRSNAQKSSKSGSNCLLSFQILIVTILNCIFSCTTNI